MNEKGMPLVSIIIRTCCRPKTLKRALDSIRRQNYPNIEVVVVEDGKSVSEQFLKRNYRDLDIIYFCTQDRVGRCKAGNIGLSLAGGRYVNFLDDDDILLPDHISTLADILMAEDVRVAYAIAEEHQVGKDRRTGRIVVRRKCIKYKQPFNRLLLCYMNYLPIQSVMFERSLYKECGGFDESLDIYEDWDMWLRFALKERFCFVPSITSVYYTPYRGNGKKQRDVSMHAQEQAVVQKHEQYILQMDTKQIREEMDYILNVYNKKRILFYLQKVRNYLLYRDY